MKKEKKILETKFEEIRKEIKRKKFSKESKSGLLDQYMTDNKIVEDFLISKNREIDEFSSEILNDYTGNRKELKGELENLTENFNQEMAYIIMSNEF